MQEVYRYRFYLLAILFFATLIYFWPGVPMVDSTAQYEQALRAQYTDHHPPLMSFIWHYLNKIHSGYGLMFALQLIFIYSAVFVLLRIVDFFNPSYRPIMAGLFLLLPIYPQILLYEIVILKDVQFAGSFLLVTACLAYYTLSNKRPTIPVSTVLLLIMLYGTAVKYQAQFCVIVLCFWLGILLNQQRALWRKAIAGLFLFLLIFFGVKAINNWLVPVPQKNYSWQFVKLYDLAAISLQVKQDLIPEFSKRDNYTYTKLEQRFGYPAVDSLVLLDDPILQISRFPSEMQDLRNTWASNIIRHPGPYLKHRAKNMRNILLTRPGYNREAHDIPYSLVNDVPKEYKITRAVVEYTLGTLFYLFMSHGTTIVFGIVYLILGLYYWRRSTTAPVLFGFAITALLMVGLLFFMSMAGTPRYTYITVLLLNAAHALAYACIKEQWSTTPKGV